MVRDQIAARGIRDPRLLEAMTATPRHRFVPRRLEEFAYEDRPLEIGEGQTISQPYMVALMTGALEIVEGQSVLEIGTGSGYQTAVLHRLGARVHTIELLPALAERARRALEELGYHGIAFRIGDGTQGWPERAPFDGILVAAGAPGVPETLVSQLAEGGRMVVPVGEPSEQDLLLLRRGPQGVARQNLGGCRFVKLLGREGWANL